jgi:hypothetical protein
VRILSFQRGRYASVIALAVALIFSPETLHAAAPHIQSLHPYTGPSEVGVDPSTLTGKVMCGYQGWFTTTGDGSGLNWWHYSKTGPLSPGNCGFDLWPDMSELDADERFDTSFHNADGSVSQLFSSQIGKTVDRHFAWMQQYGIDGVFVQRFATNAMNATPLQHLNTVLDHCRAGANRHGRVYAVMYDLSGVKAGQMARVMDDWKSLVDGMKLTRDPADKAYLHHHGKPVVAVWGVGFNDHRSYTLAECGELVKFLKDDPKYGGCTVMLGVPTYWRTLERDAVKDPQLHAVIQQADIVSPWTVGRYGSPDAATQYAQQQLTGDIQWCMDHNLECMPVVFPGFSWHNLNPKSKSDQIPRLKGKFLWTQFAAAKKAGATMIYQAMFDEVNEGTAIFKCTNSPPVGASQFITYEGLPSDYYLWLVNQGRQMLDGKIPVSQDVPRRGNPN